MSATESIRKVYFKIKLIIFIFIVFNSLFLNASISFRTVSSEFVYTKQNITDIIKTIQFVNISPIPGLTYTPNKDLVVQSNLMIIFYNFLIQYLISKLISSERKMDRI